MAIQNDPPRSRLTLTYKTTVNGVVQKINLPFRMMVIEIFSAGQQAEKDKDLDNRKAHSITGNNLITDE